VSLKPFFDHAAAHPDRVALIERAGNAVSYGALEQRSARLAAALRRAGIGKDARVLVALWPGSDLYAALIALWRLGAVAVFPEPAMGLAGLRHAAAAARPAALLAPHWLGALCRLLPETRNIAIRLTASNPGDAALSATVALKEDDAALISFTSGSTGKPKGIVRTHGLLLAQHCALAPLLAPAEQNEIDLVAFPAFVLSALCHGVTAALPRWNLRRHDRAEGQAVRCQICDQRVTRALLPPVVAAALAECAPPASLRRVLSGGGPVYPDMARRFLANAPHCGLTVVYGSTEAEPISHIAMTLSDDALWADIAGGGGLPVGVPVPETKVRIAGSEILVAGPHVVKGYLDPARDGETKIRDGDVLWHRTGDAGRFDAKGGLWLLGRMQSLAGGLYPFAAESAARLWPGVRAAAFASARGKALLFVAGDRTRLGEWRKRAAKLGEIETVAVASIPMDKRHRSKPDLNALLAAWRRG
jgi:olefin beta-lactone synthetase